MERLTGRYEASGIAKYCPSGNHVLIQNMSNSAVQKVLDRLAAYEDTGFEPYEIQCYVPLFKEWHENTGALRYIHELLQAEEQGLLVRLPCKAGDTLYIPDKDAGTVREVSVRCITIENDDVFIECKFDCFTWNCPCALGGFRWGGEEYDCENYCVFTISDFGKIVFLTREEAEAALAKDTNVPNKEG